MTNRKKEGQEPMSLTEDNWVSVAKIGRPHGVRGAFFVSGRNELLPKNIKMLLIGNPTSSQKPSFSANDHTVAHIEKQYVASGRDVFKCSLFTNKDELKEWMHCPILIPREDIEIEDDEEYLWQELLQKQVLVDGSVAGSIIEVENFGASDLITVQNSETRKKFSVPFVNDYFDMSFTPQDQQIQCHLSQEQWNEFQ